MVDEREAQPSFERRLDPQRIVSHLEAALPEMDAYDATSAFLLRLAIESMRRCEAAAKDETATLHDAA
jgi:hypothetical protein